MTIAFSLTHNLTTTSNIDPPLEELSLALGIGCQLGTTAWADSVNGETNVDLFQPKECVFAFSF